MACDLNGASDMCEDFKTDQRGLQYEQIVLMTCHVLSISNCLSGFEPPTNTSVAVREYINIHWPIMR